MVEPIDVTVGAANQDTSRIAEPLTVRENQKQTGGKPAAPGASPQERAMGVRQSDVLRNGTDRIIEISPKVADLLKNRMINRSRDALALQKKGVDLSIMDKMFLDKDYLALAEKGIFTRESMALAWFDIQDELLLKQLATARAIRERPSTSDTFRDFPLIGRLAGMDVAVLDSALAGERVGNYMKDMRFDDYPAVEKELRNLEKLRIEMEKTFFRNGIRNPLVDRIRDSISERTYQDPVYSDVLHKFNIPANPADGTPIATEFRKTGHIFRDEVVDQLEGVLRQNGTDLATALAGDPLLLIKSVQKANELALAHVADERAQRILSNEKRQTTAQELQTISGKATELGTKPAKKDLTPAELAKKAKDEADLAEKTRIASSRGERTTSLETRLSNLKARADTLRDTEIPSAEIRAEEAHETYIKLEPGLTIEIGTLTTLAKNLRSERKNVKAPPGTPATKVAPFIQAERDRLTSELTDAETQLNARRNELRTLNQTDAREAVKLKTLQNEFQRITGRLPGGAAGPVLATGEIDAADLDLTHARTEQKTAEDERDAQKKVVDKWTAEPVIEEKSKEASEGLKIWAGSESNKGKIHKTLYSETSGGRFTMDVLKESNIIGGQMAGVEAFRDLVLNVPNGGKVSPELRRKMASDGFVAETAIEVFQLDGSTPPLFPILTDIASLRIALDAIPAKNTALRAAQQAKIDAKERELLVEVWPKLETATPFQFGALANKIIDNGVGFASANANPYVHLL